ncbi:MAG: hypothetical protein REH79_03215 [Spiroplasma sp.]|nr:hypothetical protein [Spiroplasma sp.]
MTKQVPLKNKWQKLPIGEKTIIILFLIALFCLIAGIIILLTVKVNHGLFNGFNMVRNVGVIPSLKYYEPNNLVNLIFLKIGIIMTIFLMPICAGISISWFAINRLFF